MNLGSFNFLRVSEKNELGLILRDEDSKQTIFLPWRDVPEDQNIDVGNELDVFVYNGERGELLASLEGPYALVGNFAQLEVVGVTDKGAFLDWGLRKDLFLPASEQIMSLENGDEVVVYVRLDRMGKISATQRLEERTEFPEPVYRIGEEVTLWIAGKTELGYKVVINEIHLGVVYSNEVFTPLEYGKITKGFIKKIREDEKIDVSLTRLGHEASQDIGPLILKALKNADGFLPVHDRTDPATVYKMFGVSKNKFKIAIGDLYKRRLIEISDDGIRLPS